MSKIEICKIRSARENRNVYDIVKDAIIKLIVNFATNCGIKNMGDKTSKSQIIYYIINYHKDLIVADIKLAFDYYVTGKIEIPAYKHHYGKLTPKFINDVLIEYKKKKQIAILNKTYPYLNQIKTQHKEQEIKIKRVAKADELRKEYTYYKKTGRLLTFFPEIYFDWLKEKKYIILTDNQIKNAKKKASIKKKIDSKNKLKNHTPMALSDLLNENSSDKPNWKKIIIMELFDSYLKKGKTPNQLFVKNQS